MTAKADFPVQQKKEDQADEMPGPLYKKYS
jgi:hypothetical protein